MLKIEQIENASKSQEAFDDAKINYTLYWAYMNSKSNGNELLDFNDVIWDYDVQEIVSQLRAFGVEKFTISTPYSSLLAIIQKFIEFGCTLEGMTMVTGDKPALLIKL